MGYWLLLLGLSSAGFSVPAPAVSSGTAVAEDYLRRSVAQYAVKDYAGSRASAEAAIALDPADAHAYVLRGRAELGLGAYTEAEADAVKALGLGHRKAAAYNLRSQARLKLGRFTDARSDADEAIRAYPSGGAGFVNRAAAKTALHASAEDVLSDYRRAAELDHRYASLYELEKHHLEPHTATPAVATSSATSAPVTHSLRTPAIISTPPPAPAPKPDKAAPSSTPPPLPGFRAWVWNHALIILLAGIAAATLISRYRIHQLRRVRFGTIISPYKSPVEFRAGIVVGKRYIIGQLLERRPQVEIYDGRDLSDEPRRIKRLLPLSSDPEIQARLLDAAGKAAFLRHPRLECIETVFKEGKQVCLGAVAFAGQPLQQMREKTPSKVLSPTEAYGHLRAVCEGLQAAHRHGVAHGHLSPRAICIGLSGAAVLDFGLPLDDWERRYQAPESQPSAEGDLYALSVCFFELLTGRLPPAQGTGGEGRAGVPAAPVAPPNGLETFFIRAFDRDPAKRFKSAAELVAAYKALVPEAS